MVTVRSVVATMVTPAGRVCSSWPGGVLSRHVLSPAQKVCGRIFLMLLTTPITLAPGWRWMFRTMAGVVFCSAPCWVFCTPAITVATSRRKIGRPFL